MFKMNIQTDWVFTAKQTITNDNKPIGNIMNAKQTKLINNLPSVSSLPVAKGKKGEIPTFDNSALDDAIVDAVDSFIAAQAAKAEAEAAQTEAKPVIAAAAVSLLNDLATSGQFSKSVKLSGATGTLTISRMDKFSIDKDASIADLEKSFGKDFVKANFEETTEILLNPAVLKDNKLMKELIELVGKENLGKFFVQSRTISTVKGFDEAVFALTDEQREVATAGMIKQAAVSIK